MRIRQQEYDSDRNTEQRKEVKGRNGINGGAPKRWVAVKDDRLPKDGRRVQCDLSHVKRKTSGGRGTKGCRGNTPAPRRMCMLLNVDSYSLRACVMTWRNC